MHNAHTPTSSSLAEMLNIEKHQPAEYATGRPTKDRHCMAIILYNSCNLKKPIKMITTIHVGCLNLKVYKTKNSGVLRTNQ